MKKSNASQSTRRGKGFRHASGLVSQRIREAGESRGFAVARLLTHWSEIAGEEIANRARPVEVTYGRGGLGATLTVLTTGAQAPMLEMQKETLRERVNRCYGYTAISRIRITQTAATGFEEGQIAFQPAPDSAGVAPAADPKVKKKARESTAEIHDDGLRSALSALAENILNKKSTQIRQ